MSKIKTPEQSIVLLDTNPKNYSLLIKILKLKGVNMDKTISIMTFDPKFPYLAWQPIHLPDGSVTGYITHSSKPGGRIRVNTAQEFLKLFGIESSKK